MGMDAARTWSLTSESCADMARVIFIMAARSRKLVRGTESRASSDLAVSRSDVCSDRQIIFPFTFHRA